MSLVVLAACVCPGRAAAQNLTSDANASAAQYVTTASPEATPTRRMLGPAGPPQPFPEAKSIAQPKNDAELASAIRQLATVLASSGRFSGSIMLAIDGKPLLDQAWGESDRARHTPNQPETAYDIGSIGKLFTQIAILQLVDAGKLNLYAPFGNYLPDYPNRAVAEKVTIRQLLLHTSGMGDFFNRVPGDMKLSSLRQLRDFVPLFVDQPLEFVPGSATRYSNAGYIVLGLLIETVSGENYYDYVDQHILKKAGMAHSGFFDRANLPPTVAHSYDGEHEVTDMHPRRGSSAGGLQASTGDLFRLVQAIDTAKLISRESIKLLRDLIPRPSNAPPPSDEAKLTGYGIEGGAPGVSAQLVIDSTGRYLRIILCNGSPPMAMAMGATIRERLKEIPK